MNKLQLLLATGVGAAGGFVAARRITGGGSGTAGQDTMERIVHIARIRVGNEADLRRLVRDRFPVSALAESGIQEFTIFIGSTYLLTEYGFTGEYTPVFTAFRNNPVVNAFLEEIGQLLDDEPAPLPDAPAMQVLASQAFHWKISQDVEFTPRVRSKEQSADRV